MPHEVAALPSEVPELQRHRRPTHPHNRLNPVHLDAEGGASCVGEAGLTEEGFEGKVRVGEAAEEGGLSCLALAHHHHADEEHLRDALGQILKESQHRLRRPAEIGWNAVKRVASHVQRARAAEGRGDEGGGEVVELVAFELQPCEALELSDLRGELEDVIVAHVDGDEGGREVGDSGERVVVCDEHLEGVEFGDGVWENLKEVVRNVEVHEAREGVHRRVDGNESVVGDVEVVEGGARRKRRREVPQHVVANAAPAQLPEGRETGRESEDGVVAQVQAREESHACQLLFSLERDGVVAEVERVQVLSDVRHRAHRRCCSA
mmetsp:Transcript_27313/g.55811  ORF Transcript_27313/g.55811 Transcript_27313/m.55811 type:complete len:321 (-) Transcript_27313:1015-1977(-)